MAARWDRRFFLGATALLGAVLVGLALVLQMGDSRRRSAPPPEPPWRTADRSAAYLEKQLRPIALSDSAGVVRVLAALRELKFLECTGEPTTWHMTRSFNSGHEFESEIVLTCSAVAAGHDVELSATRAGKEPLQLRMAVRAGVITGVETGGGTPLVWQPWTGAEAFPLALGDLQVGEALQLGRACAGRSFKPLGYLNGMGARSQLVLETDLVPAARATPPAAEDRVPAAAGARALAYVDSATSELRSVRVLDAKGYLVCIYDGMAWAMAAPRSPLASLRVTGIPSSSHTQLRRVVATTSP